MSIMLLYGCAQVELTVRDINAARTFMQDVLGATQIEQQLVSEIRSLFPGGGYDVDHLNCGEGMFQFNEPSEGLSFDGHKVIHQVYLDQVGPCVTNLNFFIDDAQHAHDLLTNMGAKTHIQGTSSAARSLAEYGPGNTRPGGDLRNFYFLGSRDLIGLDLEMMEPNFHRFSEQSLQYPCFVRPRPPSGDDNLKLLRLRLVVPNLDETYRNLVEIFVPACRSNPYDIREGTFGRAFRIGVGGIELEYCEPQSVAGKLADALEHYGPGVMTVEFGAVDLQRAVAQARKGSSLPVTEQPDLLGMRTASNEQRFEIASRATVGFDVTLEQFDPPMGVSGLSGDVTP